MSFTSTTTFNGVAIPSGVLVKSVKHVMLPPVSQITTKIPGKAGEYDHGNEIGPREIVLDLLIKLTTQNTLPSKLAELAKWVYSTEAKKLILGDNPNNYYLAKFNGTSEFDEEGLHATGSIKFICYDPYIYGQPVVVNLPTSMTDSTVVQITNSGTGDVYPVFDFVVSQNLTSMTVLADDEYVELGEPFNVYVASTYPPHNPEPSTIKYVSKAGSAFPSSTTLTEIQDQDGRLSLVVKGSDLSYFGQQDNNYGAVGTKPWHGGIRQFTGTRAINDFEFKASFSVNSPSKQSQMGRIAWDILDVSGEIMTRIMVYDLWAGVNQWKYEIQMFDAAGVKTLFATHTKAGKNVGYVRFWRNNQKFFFEIAEKVVTTNSAGVSTTTYKQIYKWSSSNSLGTYDRAVKDVRISFGAFQSYLASEMTGYSFELKELNVANPTPPPTPEEGTSDIIIESGDRIIIDCNSGGIEINDSEAFHFLNPNSTYIKLESGANGISFSPAAAISGGTISYVPRSL